jgi:hypothetical protein
MQRLLPRLSLAVALVASAAAQADYARDVLPILSETCFPCHGPDAAAREADLRLDRRADALAAGAFEPRAPERSELLRRVRAEDPSERMPPPETRKRVTADQAEVLADWIAAGAPYDEHWAWSAPARPPLPADDGGWARNPIDRFVLARLRAAGLEPAPEADRRTLARRLSYDLTGLPPDPDEVQRFLDDDAPDAYERLVRRWIDTPQWGEHRARYWLDVARYADTHGIHFDNYREMWAYRDWVIAAFERDLPFDTFTLEQLAGDLLPAPTLDQRVATGFLRCNITTNEGGIIDEEYQVLYARDRTETFGQAWLGLSLGCAVCHDHKYDPLRQREFYALSAFFDNTTQAVRDGNVKDTPPVLPVPLAGDRARAAELEELVARARQELEERAASARPDFARWLASAAPRDVSAAIPADSLLLCAPLDAGAGRAAAVLVAGSARDVALADSAEWEEGPCGGRALRTAGAALELPDAGDLDGGPFTCAAWVKLRPNDTFGALCARMEESNAYRGWDLWVQRRQVGAHVIHRWPDDALKVVGKQQVPADVWTHVAVTYDGSSSAAGLAVYYDGAPQETDVEADGLAGTTRTGVPFKVGQRHDSAASGAAVCDLRLYGRALAPDEVASLARSSVLATLLARAERTEAEQDELYRWWLAAVDQESRARQARVDALERERADIRARGTVAHVVVERDDAPGAYVLFRGEYDQRREAVGAATPAFLSAWPTDLPRNRLGLARWLLDPRNPLAARVTVNRFWQEVFGAGLVATSGDFGVAGELPSHPALLDWLAVEFRASGWGVKDLFTLIVTSATYRQSAAATPEKLARDPANHLLSRGPRFRMDAEMIRDTALAASGLLAREIGGPSVRPYQPPGVWEAVAMPESNTRDYRPDAGDALYRRSLYTFWKRAAPPASMQIFDAPSREVCTVRRERTNTPLQALVTLNDPQFVEASRALAEDALRRAREPRARADALLERLAARPLDEREWQIVRATARDLAAYYAEHPDDALALLAVGASPRDEALDAPTVATWTMIASQLMNLDEVLNK